MLSIHTSPLEQPGTGDAGGMNVYVAHTARRLAAAGTQVDIFTRATSSDLPPVVELADGVLVRHVTAGPYQGLAKQDLPGQLCAFAAGVLQVEARHDAGWYDLVHSHYWLSGQVGWLAADRWNVPLVHTMHTMAKVKNASLATGDNPEPEGRVIGEEQVVARADRLTANTEEEAEQLRLLYGAPASKIAVVPPGVDLDVFRPGGPEGRASARRRLGLPASGGLIVFVGRVQPLKAPDVLVEALARMGTQRWSGDGVTLAIVGGPSGSGMQRPEQLQRLAADLGVAASVRFVPPATPPVLADWYRAADVVAVPSHSESFGLVAVEAQACGTPVVAAAVGGLRTAVRDGVTGLLVPGHDPRLWAHVLADLLRDRGRRRRLEAEARAHASRYSWDATVERLLVTYRDALEEGQRARRPVAALARPLGAAAAGT